MSKLAKIALVLVVLLTASIGLTAGFPPSDAATKGADRLFITQNYDGTWEWENPDLNPGNGIADDPSPDYPNCVGVTAQGLLDIYQRTGDAKYSSGAKVSADTIKTWTRCGEGDEQKTQSFDFYFLMDFADVSGDSSYSDHALDEWENCYKTEKAAFYGDGNQDALVGWYLSKGDGYTLWQGGNWILATLAMGDTDWAEDMADELTTDTTETGGTYDVVEHLDTGDDVAYAGAGLMIRALRELDAVAYASDINTLKQFLLDNQETDGSWDSNNPDGVSQDTAYAVMGLMSIDETEAAEDGAEWLKDHQFITGGWGDSPENTEVTSEAVQALLLTDNLWFEDLDDRITYLEGRVDNLRGDFTTFQTETENRLSDLEGWRVTLTDTIDNILSRLSAIEEWIEEHGGEVPPEHYCGDGVCDDDETPETCPQDCQEAPPGEVFLEENWDVTCPVSGYVYCRVELWKDGWLLNDNIILEPGQPKRVNHYAGYNLKMFGMPD